MSNKYNDIGGWLWVIMIILIGSGFSEAIGLIKLFINLFNENIGNFFSSDDKMIRFRIYFNVIMILLLSINLSLVIFCLFDFFNRKKRFTKLFLSLIGFFIISEIVRVLLYEYYIDMVGISDYIIVNNIVNIGILGMLSGLYLNKGKRPIRTFIN